MTNIKIDCFGTTNFCQVSSLDKSIKINNPLGKETILEIFNHGTSSCTVKMKAKNFPINNDLKMANLMVSNVNKIFFKGSFLDFTKTETALDSIAPESSISYFFSMDLLSLVLEEKQLVFDFDLIFDFNCGTYVEEKNQIRNTVSAVLSSSDSASESAELSDSFFKSPVFFLLLSILFVAIFFVIMKFINDQKKKKQAKIMD